MEVYSGVDSHFISTFLNLPNARASLKFINDNECSLQTDKFKMVNRKVPDYARIGPNLLDHKIFYCTKSLSNWRRGVVKRVAHATNCQRNVCVDFYHFIETQIIPKLPVAPKFDHSKLLEDWLSCSRYDTKRKNKLRFLSYKNIKRVQKFPKHFFHCKSFIKSEFYNDIKEPRIINSRTDDFKSVIGPYTHLTESCVFDSHFIKHKTPDEIAQIMQNMSTSYSNFYGTDYSSFEGSFRRDLMLSVEFKMFERVLHNYPHIVKLIEQTYRYDNVIKYQIHGKRKATARFEGSRMSGDMWTSLSNGFTNYCLVKYVMHKNATNGEFRYDFLVEGDDGFICCDREIDFSIVRDLGFQLKCDHFKSINDMSFCGICVHDGLLVPDFWRIMNKYGYSHDRTSIRYLQTKTNRQKRNFKNMVHSRALSLLAQSRGIPILQAIAQQQLTFGGHYDPRYVDWWENEVYDFSNVTSMTALPITQSMRQFFADRYDIPIDIQYRIEDQIKASIDICYNIDLPCRRPR